MTASNDVVANLIVKGKVRTLFMLFHVVVVSYVTVLLKSDTTCSGFDVVFVS